METTFAAFGTLFTIFLVILGLATIFLPIFVMIITLRVHDCVKLLRSMEHMMRIERSIHTVQGGKPTPRR